jgi:hypothetical protein
MILCLSPALSEAVSSQIVSGDIPWKEKKSPQICIELSKKVTPARPNNVSDNHWYLIQKCWSFYPRHRPGSSEVLQGVMPRGIAARKGTRDILQVRDLRGRSSDSLRLHRNIKADRQPMESVKGEIFLLLAELPPCVSVCFDF